MPLINLTPELAAAAAPIQNAAQARPTAVLPIQNALPADAPGVLDQTAPAQPVQPAPAAPADQTIVSQIHQGADAAAAATPPAQRGKPGQWAANILQGLNRAFSGVETGMGDAVTANAEIAANFPRGGAGALDYLGAQQNAKMARQAAQSKAQTEQDRQKAETAKINVDTNFQEVLLHSLEGKRADEANDQAISNGKAAVEFATTGNEEYGLEPGKILQADISEAQLHQALHDKSLNPEQETFWATGKVPVMDDGKQRLDEAGNPVWAKTYSIISTPPTVILDKKLADFLNTNLGSKLQEGTRLPGVVALSQFQQANNAHALLEKQKDERDTAELKEATNQQKLDQIRAGKNLGADFFQIAAQSDLNLNSTMSFITGQHMVPGTLNGKPGMVVDPRSRDYAAVHPNAGNDFINFMGGLSDYTKIRDSQVSELEKERHDAAEEAEKKVEDLKKENENGSWSLQENENGVPVLLNSKNGQTMPAPAGVQPRGTKSKLDAAFKKESEPAIAALGYANNYLSNGVFTGAGDEALQERFFELAKPTAGFRMTAPQMDMLQFSRSWMGSSEAKALHASTGTWFSPTQRKQIVDTMQQLANSKLQALHASAGQSTNATAAPENHQVKLASGGTATKKNGKWINDQTNQEVK